MLNLKSNGNALRLSLLGIALIGLLVSCHNEVKPRLAAIADRASTPVLAADTVTTLISDSGITRYRIQSIQWDIYDKAVPSYWEFPKGIYLEKFNEDLQPEASIRADYAHYNDVDQLWELDGNVVAVNLAGEQFETQQLMWNQKEERVYSDSSITITKATSIIQGIGFESNQEMSKYTILHPQGVFPIDDK